jgi:hypothetical protein
MNHRHRVLRIFGLARPGDFPDGSGLLSGTTATGLSAGGQGDTHRDSMEPRSERRPVPDGGPEQGQESRLERIFGVGLPEQVATDAPHHWPMPGDELGECGVVVPDQGQQIRVGPRVPEGPVDE